MWAKNMHYFMILECVTTFVKGFGGLDEVEVGRYRGHWQGLDELLVAEGMIHQGAGDTHHS